MAGVQVLRSKACKLVALQSNVLHVSRVLQSRLGWACLLLSTSHALVNGYSSLLTHDCIFPSSKLVPLLLPLLTILLKVPLLLPCLDSRLTRIREGRLYPSICCC